jgi:hypothetical protein
MYGLTENEGEKLAELAGAPSIQVLREMIRDNLQCQNGYTLPVVAAPIHLLRAKQWDNDTAFSSLEEHARLDLGWSRFGLELASLVMVEGDHNSLYTHPETPGHINALFQPDLRKNPPIEITDPNLKKDINGRSDNTLTLLESS